MSEKIKPALTAEEWADEVRRQQFESSARSSAEVWDKGPSIRFRAGVETQTGEHAIAAACLYGQPFGFTREDVSILQSALTRLGEDGKRHRRVASLKARIAALLPPEDTT